MHEPDDEAPKCCACGGRYFKPILLLVAGAVLFLAFFSDTEHTVLL